jgi:tetratricopeptide (TPR) repeat protein
MIEQIEYPQIFRASFGNSLFTAFLISESGYLLTTSHSFPNDFDTKTLIQCYNNYFKLQANLIFRSIDADCDFALLKIIGSTTKLPTPLLIRSSKIDDNIEVYGYGFGEAINRPDLDQLNLSKFGGTVANGFSFDRKSDLRQVIPGDSGAPIFDKDLKYVIGINHQRDAKLLETEYIFRGYILPISHINDHLKQNNFKDFNFALLFENDRKKVLKSKIEEINKDIKKKENEICSVKPSVKKKPIKDRDKLRSEKSKLLKELKRLNRKLLYKRFKNLIPAILILLLFIIAYLIYPTIINDKIFSKDDPRYKVLVLKFGKIGSEKEIDIGKTITIKLNEYNLKDKLNLNVFYFDKPISVNFNKDSAEILKNYHNADLIVYGTYKAGDCSSNDLNKVCFNYLSKNEEKISPELNIRISSEQIDNGLLQGDVNFIVYWVSIMSNYNTSNCQEVISRCESLKKTLLEENNLTQIYKINSISFNCLFGKTKNSEELINFASNNLNLAMKYNDTLEMSYSYRDIAMTYLLKSDFKLAIHFMKEAIAAANVIRERENSGLLFTFKLADYKCELGDLYQGNQNYPEAIEAYLSAINLFGNYKFSQLAYSYSSLSYVYYRQENYKEAEKYIKKAIEVYQQTLRTDRYLLQEAKNNSNLNLQGLEYNFENDQKALNEANKRLGLYLNAEFQNTIKQKPISIKH